MTTNLRQSRITVDRNPLGRAATHTGQTTFETAAPIRESPEGFDSYPPSRISREV